jgi:hypothetical protein
MAANFLHANNRNYFVVATIIVSRKFISMDRKSCLLMCYEEQIDIELWMVEGAATLNGSLHSRTVEGKIRRIWEPCKEVLIFLFSSISGDSRLD